ncbi:hypothetical protein ACI784_14720 [Geodermatophilus sp. SYSU D01186]
MTDSTTECTCSRLPDGSGGSLPAAWLGMHERVAVNTVDETRIEGRAAPLWLSESEVVLMMTTDEGDSFKPSLSRLRSAEPLTAPDLTQVITSVFRYLGRPSEIPSGGVHFRVIADEHHYVQVAVSVEPQPCLTL